MYLLICTITVYLYNFHISSLHLESSGNCKELQKVRLITIRSKRGHGSVI